MLQRRAVLATGNGLHDGRSLWAGCSSLMLTPRAAAAHNASSSCRGGTQEEFRHRRSTCPVAPWAQRAERVSGLAWHPSLPAFRWHFGLVRLDDSGGCGAQQALEGGTFHVAGGATGRGVAQPLANGR